VRAEVRYGDPVDREYRDLWIIRLGADGRCVAFEEWPFAPGPVAVAHAGGPEEESRERGEAVERVRDVLAAERRTTRGG